MRSPSLLLSRMEPTVDATDTRKITTRDRRLHLLSATSEIQGRLMRCPSRLRVTGTRTFDQRRGKRSRRSGPGGDPRPFLLFLFDLDFKISGAILGRLLRVVQDYLQGSDPHQAGLWCVSFWPWWRRSSPVTLFRRGL